MSFAKLFYIKKLSLFPVVLGVFQHSYMYNLFTMCSNISLINYVVRRLLDKFYLPFDEVIEMK